MAVALDAGRRSPRPQLTFKNPYVLFLSLKKYTNVYPQRDRKTNHLQPLFFIQLSTKETDWVVVKYLYFFQWY